MTSFKQLLMASSSASSLFAIVCFCLFVNDYLLLLLTLFSLGGGGAHCPRADFNE